MYGTEMQLLHVKRGDLQLLSDTKFSIKGEEHGMSKGQLKKLIEFATLQSKSYDHVNKSTSHEEAVAITNKFLQTEKMRHQDISVYMDKGGLVDISEENREVNPEKFIVLVNRFCERFGLKVEKEFYRGGYHINCSLDQPFELGGKDIYKPGVAFVYTPDQVAMNLSLTRLSCTNGATTKIKGTSVNLGRLEYVKRADNVIAEIIKKPNEIYLPVYQALEQARQTPASLDDVIQFKNRFEPYLGEQSEEIFRTGEAMSLYRNMPENPNKTWLSTAPVPMTCFDLYNIGTNLTSHNEKAMDLALIIFLGNYLFQKKSLENICKETPSDRQIYADIARLRGE